MDAFEKKIQQLSARRLAQIVQENQKESQFFRSGSETEKFHNPMNQGSIIKKPVRAQDGNIYQKEDITRYFSTPRFTEHKMSPLSHVLIGTTLADEDDLQVQLRNYLKRYVRSNPQTFLPKIVRRK